MAKALRGSKKCYACGREKSKGHLGYDVYTLKTYCIDESRCMPANRPERLKLVPPDYDAVLEAIREEFPEDVAMALEKIIGKSASFRVTPAIAMHLLKYAQEYGIGTINATITSIFEQHMEDHNFDNIDLKFCDWELSAKPINWRAKKEEEKEETKPEPEAKAKPAEEPKQKDEEVAEGLEI